MKINVSPVFRIGSTTNRSNVGSDQHDSNVEFPDLVPLWRGSTWVHRSPSAIRFSLSQPVDLEDQKERSLFPSFRSFGDGEAKIRGYCSRKRTCENCRRLLDSADAFVARCEHRCCHSMEPMRFDDYCWKIWNGFGFLLQMDAHCRPSCVEKNSRWHSSILKASETHGNQRRHVFSLSPFFDREDEEEEEGLKGQNGRSRRQINR